MFQYYRYNDARMEYPEMTAAETGQAYDESKERFYEEFIYGDYRGADLRGYALDLPRLYVIVSSGTASASEAVACFAGNRTRSGAGRAEDQRQKMWGWRVSIWRMERTNTSSCRSLSRDITPGSKRWTRTVLRRML